MSTNSAQTFLDTDTIAARLREAGSALLALPDTGPSTRLVQSNLVWLRDAAAHGSGDTRKIRPAIPDAATITRMDEALAWILLIPQESYVLRRIVGARCLVDPLTGRHLYSWRRIGAAIGADHKAVQRWHDQGIARIAAALRTPQGRINTAPCRSRPVITAAPMPDKANAATHRA